jgi:hypothetical protein
MTIIPTVPPLTSSSCWVREKEERDESRVGGTDHDGGEMMVMTTMASSVAAVVTPGSTRSGTDRSFFPPSSVSSIADRQCF